ncbi:hypothetical protein KFK09_028653 [Dendrobium nobile]|uniref:Transmembrane protein n=1 Tax=Dendrobium nobile TaxID=94219 RepID=A0A8T3A2I4_DENNO|nr:hypothetical protein KFK09_028653 [Dendrobium nobile]
MAMQMEASIDSGEIMFYVVIIWLLVVSIIIFASFDGDDQIYRRSKTTGPQFVGGKGCGCGGCQAGVGVCGTYLS